MSSTEHSVDSSLLHWAPWWRSPAPDRSLSSPDSTYSTSTTFNCSWWLLWEIQFDFVCVLADVTIISLSGYRGDFFRWIETGDEFSLLYLHVCSFKAKSFMITWHRPTLCSIMAPPSSTAVITQHVLHKEKPRSVHLEHEGMKSTLQSLQTESRATGSYLVPVLWCDASSASYKYDLRMILKEKWFVLLSLAPPCNKVRQNPIIFNNIQPSLLIRH